MWALPITPARRFCGTFLLPQSRARSRHWWALRRRQTTVSRLAARFWDYQKGSITVGGMEVSQIDPEKLMSLYSIVFQDVTLFDNTILENIRLGRKGATDEEVLAAAKLANYEEFDEKLPDKWNTNIGENGCALSGGERQRISIARAFLKDAPIILLDEATASLDVENETAIQEALSRLIKTKPSSSSPTGCAP